VGLAPHLPEPLLGEALAAARAIEDAGWRAQALERLIPRLAELGYPQEALAAARAIGDAGRRAEALTKLTPYLAGLPIGTIYALWCETLHHLATRTRRDLLADLRDLAPAITAMGGAEAVREIIRAIQDVGRWWP
jgi:hypothetical protein